MSTEPGFEERLRTLSAGSVVKVGVIVYVLSALLNSSNLVDMANRMPLSSPERGPALAIAKGVDSLSSALRLTEPGLRLDAYRGITPVVNPGSAFGTTATTVAPDVSPVETEPGATVPVTEAAPATLPPVTEPPTTVPKVPTAATPLKLYLGGDSLVQGWGSVVQRLAVATRIVNASEVDYKPATGLSRPDSFDWPNELVKQMSSGRPQVVIVGFGGNDAQGLLIGGKPFQPGSPEWRAEYARRVGETMDYLTRDGRKVIWVGTPVPQDATDLQRQKIINEIYREEVAKRATAVTFVDTWVEMANAEDSYAAYMVDDDGVTKLMRQSDGFHLSVPGAERMGRRIFGVLLEELKARGATI